MKSENLTPLNVLRKDWKTFEVMIDDIFMSAALEWHKEWRKVDRDIATSRDIKIRKVIRYGHYLGWLDGKQKMTDYLKDERKRWFGE